MPTKSRQISTKPAAPVIAKAAVAAKRVIAVPGANKPIAAGAVAAAKAALNSNVTTPAGKSVAAKIVAAASTPAVAKPSGSITRTARTVLAQRANFGGLSDRDNAYLAFFAGFAKRDNGTVTLPAIVESKRHPVYVGSAKPHDAGVIIRLGKAGLLTTNADATSFTFTPAGKALAAYSTAPVAPKA